uniref:DSPn domain-containing protein n=1 Tax=Nippostrongylus brasiliensis TaxID=27835 RepID=A0A0N4XRL3_NIPBR
LKLFRTSEVIRSTDHGTSEFSTQLLTSTESAEGIQATSTGAVEFLSTAGTDDSAPPVLTTEEPQVETTEFVVTTTTHPPFCIPYRDHLQITFCHRNFMRKLNELKEESPESTSVRFPLFNVTLETLISICDDLSDTRKCMGGVDKLCIHPEEPVCKRSIEISNSLFQERKSQKGNRERVSPHMA